MGIFLVIFLVLIAISLFVSVRKKWISGDTLGTLANIAGIVALVAAAAVFVVPPAPSPPDTPPTPTFTPEPKPIITPESVSSDLTGIVGTVKKGDSLGFRTGPGFEYELLMTLSSKIDDTSVTAIVMHNSKEWVLVQLPKRTTKGWVLANSSSIEWSKNPNNLSIVPYPLVTGSVVEDDSLPIRSEPNTNSDLLKTSSVEEQIIATGRSSAGDWIFVLLSDGTEGWVLRLSKSVEWSGDLNTLPEKAS